MKTQCVKKIVYALMFLCEGMALSNPKATEQLKKAEIHIKSGRLVKATQLLKSIVKQYPRYQEAYLALGRVMYSKGNISKALFYFEKVNVKKLDPAAAFEYGMAYYDSGECENTIEAFSKVTNNHPLYSYAQYYSGVCYFNQESFQSSLESFSLANKLPSSLNNSKTTLEREARERLKKKQSGVALKPQPSAKIPQSAGSQWAPLPVEPGEISKKQAKAQEGVNKGYFQLTKNPLAQYLNSEVYQVFGDDRNTTVRQNQLLAGLNLTGRYNGAVRTGGRPYVYLTLGAERVTKSLNSSDLRFYESEDESSFGEEFAVEEEVDGEDSDDFSRYNFELNAGGPLNTNLEISGGALYQEVHPLFDQNKKYGKQAPFLNLTGNFHEFSGKLISQHTQHFNYDGDVTLSNTRGEGSVTYNASKVSVEGLIGYDANDVNRKAKVSKFTPEKVPQGSLNIGLEILYLARPFILGSHFEYKQNDPALDYDYVSESALTNIKGGLSLGIVFADVELSSKFEYGMQYDYSVIDFSAVEDSTENPLEPVNVDPANVLIGLADGSQFDLTLLAGYNLFSWLRGEVSYQYSQYNYEVTGVTNLAGDDLSATENEAFSLYLLTYKTRLNFTVSFNYSF